MQMIKKGMEPIPVGEDTKAEICSRFERNRYLRIAHLSDLHFSHLTFNPSQFFSKRWVGNLNLLLARKREFLEERLLTLPAFLKEKKVDIAIISGDLTCTAHKNEFVKARRLIDLFRAQNIEVLLVPGNHDHYTKSAYKENIFYRYFPPPSPDTTPLQAYATSLGSGWWIALLDTACATSLFSSHGEFSCAVEENLRHLLSLFSKNDRIILVNHFPFFATETPRTSLKRREHLKKLIQSFPQVKIYLHGHTHRQSVADLRSSGLPIVMESGSASLRAHGSCNLLEISQTGCTVDLYRWETDWSLFAKKTFQWNAHESTLV